MTWKIEAVAHERLSDARSAFCLVVRSLRFNARQALRLQIESISYGQIKQCRTACRALFWVAQARRFLPGRKAQKARPGKFAEIKDGRRAYGIG
ncbi:hypothetical protein SAMN02745216_00529 [Desulfatibacillum alkenivorans DSM 16219]|jgi:hypothetical protein|uniref:Uncharacterized protein n=1 Tax=Desulfatibacillum alkenivorans DSM 16219 TaxID=1121393 RepID=A0A1M6E1R4_9BACT|nr:hypothetical protein [Desulfatibacillum alkenivorans]SHI79442.1 hypothetical protein SAMN02745216_00529 [Desulfatibacillum alkenivorans DSM 16219]